jgi:presenilin-like A22 family membrane protease
LKKPFKSLADKPLQGLQGAEPHESEIEDAFFMGLGDAIIPTLLVVASSVRYASVAPALGALIGTLAGYAVLSSFAGRGKPHAGLPLLNSGSILGFTIGYLVMVV